MIHPQNPGDGSLNFDRSAEEGNVSSLGSALAFPVVPPEAFPSIHHGGHLPLLQNTGNHPGPEVFLPPLHLFRREAHRSTHLPLVGFLIHEEQASPLHAHLLRQDGKDLGIDLLQLQGEPQNLGDLVERPEPRNFLFLFFLFNSGSHGRFPRESAKRFRPHESLGWSKVSSWKWKCPAIPGSELKGEKKETQPIDLHPN